MKRTKAELAEAEENAMWLSVTDAALQNADYAFMSAMRLAQDYGLKADVAELARFRGRLKKLRRDFIPRVGRQYVKRYGL